MKRAQRLTLAALLSILCFGVGTTVIGPLLPLIANDYSFPIRYSGIIFSSNFFGFILFNINFALFLTHFDLRKVLIIALSAYTVCLLTITQVHSFLQILLLMFLIGGLGGLIESTCSVLIAKVNKEREGYYLNLSQVFFGIGAIIGPLGAGFMEQAGIAWQSIFVFIAGLSAFSGLILTACKDQVNGADEKLKRRDIFILIKNTKLLILMVCMMLYIGSEIGVWGWISTLLKNSYAVSPLEASFAVSLFWGFMTIGRFTVAKLTDYLPPKMIILILSAGATISTLILVVVHNETIIWTMIPFIGLFLSGIWPTIIVLSNKIMGDQSTPAAYLVIAAGALGGLIFPYLIGWVGNGSSVVISLGIIAIMSSMIFVLVKCFIPKVN